jgi:hypothetical protein
MPFTSLLYERTAEPATTEPTAERDTFRVPLNH